jgi:SAM-dependent methyltransferase
MDDLSKKMHAGQGGFMFARILPKLRRNNSTQKGLELISTAKFQADVKHNTGRWDDEWLSYWVTEKEYSYKYFINRRNIDEKEAMEHRSRIAALSEEELFNYDPVGYSGFAIWAKGEWVLDSTIAELGCGPGMLGKVVGPFCKRYIGIDYSPLALHVAKLTSPKNCRYLHLSELDSLGSLGQSCDLCAGRYFFIHQNWTNACWVLQLFRHLLKKGGRVSADFFAKSETEAVYNNTWMVRSPEDELNEEHPSCMFSYTDDHIHRLADACGFSVQSIDFRPEFQRRFAILVK